MRRLRYLVVALALAAMSLTTGRLPASAAAVAAQTCTATSGTTCVFGGAPANGTVVSIALGVAAAIGSVTVKDSNNVSLTQHTTACNSTTDCQAIYDYVVSGSPTATYTVSTTIATASGVDWSGVRGVGFGRAIYAQSAAASGNLTETNPAVLNGDGQVCQGYSTAATGTDAVTFSNGSKVTLANATDKRGGYSIATSGASSTCTFTATTLTNPTAVYATYTATNSFPWVEDAGSLYGASGGTVKATQVAGGGTACATGQMAFIFATIGNNGQSGLTIANSDASASTWSQIYSDTGTGGGELFFGYYHICGAGDLSGGYTVTDSSSPGGTHSVVLVFVSAAQLAFPCILGASTGAAATTTITQPITACPNSNYMSLGIFGNDSTGTQFSTSTAGWSLVLSNGNANNPGLTILQNASGSTSVTATIGSNDSLTSRGLQIEPVQPTIIIPHWMGA